MLILGTFESTNREWNRTVEKCSGKKLKSENFRVDWRTAKAVSYLSIISPKKLEK